jgi:hypothetical protein
MRIRVTDPDAHVSEWSFGTADGQAIAWISGDLGYSDGQGGHVWIVKDGEVLIADYVIENPFLIDEIWGVFEDEAVFRRHFDLDDIDQRIGLISALETDDKSSVVNGINSLKGYVDTLALSSEVSDSPFESYAAFIAGSGGGIAQGKYAYVTFTASDTWPQGGKWDRIAEGDTWRLDCGASAWLPTSDMTAATTATLTDAAATNALKVAGNDTVTSWLQSFRNNIKGLLGTVKTNGDGTKALLDNGTYGFPARRQLRRYYRNIGSSGSATITDLFSDGAFSGVSITLAADGAFSLAGHESLTSLLGTLSFGNPAGNELICSSITSVGINGAFQGAFSFDVDHMGILNGWCNPNNNCRMYWRELASEA